MPAGAALAALHAQVTATDLLPNLPLLRDNFSNNGASTMRDNPIVMHCVNFRVGTQAGFTSLAFQGLPVFS